MRSKKARITAWIVGAGALALVATADANDTFDAQMEAVVRIGTEQIDLRVENGLTLIEEARRDAVETLQVADALGVDDQTLRFAEFDAKGAVRDAARLALADLRGMATNTVVTLENFAARPDQISAIVELWDRHADTLEDAVEDALDSVEEATPAYTTISAQHVVKATPSATMTDEAQRVFDGLAGQFEAELRSTTDEVVRTLRVAKTTSMRERDEKKMFRQAARDANRAGKDMLKALKDQHKAYKRAATSRDEKRELKVMFDVAVFAVRNAMDDAQADIQAAR